MNMKKIKKFFTFARRSGGFTLVELIVVIAILAILGGVAVPAYGGYVKKANMQADISLVSEVKQALKLYYYSHPNEAVNGYVVLTQEGMPASCDDVVGEYAMRAVFGENWKDTISLKYDGWNGDYNGSSFQGNEITLMGKVEGLTDLLGQTISDMPTLVGENFKNFMGTELGFSEEDMKNSDKAADAAVLYVANGTSKLSTEQQEEFRNIAINAGKSDDVFSTMLTGYSNLYGSDVMGAAATYAMLTAYCQYEDEKAGNTKMMDALGSPDVSGVSSGSLQEMSNMITDSVSRLDSILEEGNGLNFETYWSEVAGKDAGAFIDVMGAVNNSKNQIAGSLGTSGCFTSEDLNMLFSQYGNGSIMVFVETGANGVMRIYTSETELN